MSVISLLIINLSLSLSSKRKPLQNLISVSQYALVDDQKTEARHIESLLRILLFLVISCSLKSIFLRLSPHSKFLNLCVSYEFYNKKHTQSGLFPVKLQDDELNWKIILNYAALKDAFLLAINGVSFPEMPLQTEVNKEGHQNII